MRDGSDTSDTEVGSEAGRRLFAGECRFLLGVAKLEQLPATSLPEVAFAGRSNVGKSTLLNALAGHRRLARTSSTPGRTRELNYFSIAERLICVDMPGYGYAKAPKTDVARWQALIFDYLRGRPALRRVFVLVDSRHGLKPVDREIIDLLNKAAVVFQIVLTKSDEPKKAQLEQTIAGVEEALKREPAFLSPVIPVSSHQSTGINALRNVLADIAND